MSAHAAAAGRRRPRATAACALARRQPAASAAYVAAVAFAALVVVNPIQVAILLGVIVALLAAAGRLRASLPYVRVALAVGLFLAILNPFFSRGGLDVIWQADLWVFEITLTLQGLVYGVTTALRLTAVVLAFALFNVALEPDDQLGLMSRFSFRSGLVLSLATRLLPVLSRDGSHIADAQRARGMELDRRDAQDARRGAPAPARRASYAQPGARRRRGRRHGGARLRQRTPLAMVAPAALAGRRRGPRRRRPARRRRPPRRSPRAAPWAYGFFPLLDDPWAQLTDPWWVVTVVALVVPGVVVLTRGRP